MSRGGLPAPTVISAVEGASLVLKTKCLTRVFRAALKMPSLSVEGEAAKRKKWRARAFPPPRPPDCGVSSRPA